MRVVIEGNGGGGAAGATDLATTINQFRSDTLRLARQAQSLRLLSALNTDELIGARELLDLHFRYPRGRDHGPASDAPIPEASWQKAAQAMLGFYEDVAIAIGEGAVDERILFRSLVGRMLEDYRKLRDFIQDRRDVYWTNVYSETEELLKIWRAKKAVTPGVVLDDLRINVPEEP